MSSTLQRLALMAGVTLNEAAVPKIKSIKIRLADIGITNPHEGTFGHDIDDAIEGQDVLTIEDWNLEDGTLVFYPMLTDGEVSVRDASTFRQVVSDYLSDVAGDETVESVQERKLTPAELKKREEIAKAIEKEQPGIDKSKKMAIATAQAKKVAEASTGSNKVFDEYSAWKAAAEKAGCEVFSQGAADGKYTAKHDGEVCGRFNKTDKEGWLHSSVMKEDAEQFNNPVAPAIQQPLPQGLAEIAQQLGFQTLDDGQNGAGNVAQVDAGAVREALLAAYNLGQQQGTAQATPAEQQPTSGGLPPPRTTTPADNQQQGPAGIAR